MLVVALLALLPGAVDAGSTQAAFEAAIALEGHGAYKEAAAALEKLAREHPDDAFSDDALFEEAQLYDERLGDPARAQALYAEVVRRWPNGRLAMRARNRAHDLERGLTTGAAPLVEFEAILNGFGGRDKAESRVRMEALLAAHPDFAFADRAYFWLATQAVDDQRWPAALAATDEIARRFPSSEVAPRAKKLRGDILLRTGHPFAARDVYQTLGGDPLSRAAGQEGLRAVHRAIFRRSVSIAAIVWLAAWCLARLWARRRDLRRGLPVEVFYFAGIAALFCAAAFTEHSLIRSATLMLAGGGLVVIWLAGEAPPTRLGLARRVAAIALTVAALGWLAVQSNDLTDVVLETLKAGPER